MSNIRAGMIRTAKIDSANNSRRKSTPTEHYQDPITQPQQLLQSRSGTPDDIRAYLPPSIAVIRWIVDNIPINLIYRNADRNRQGLRDCYETLERMTGQTPALLRMARDLTGLSIQSNAWDNSSGSIGSIRDQLHIYTPSRVHGAAQQRAAYERGRASAAAKHNLDIDTYDRIMYPRRYRTDTTASYITDSQAILIPVSSYTITGYKG
jgi:hypothetical protein